VLNQAKYRKNVLVRLLSSPWTLWPFVAGVTALLGLWTFSIRSGIAVFAAIAAILGGLGIFGTRLLLGSESLGREAIQELQEEARAARDKRLDELDGKLASDGDPRTEASLRDLRALAKAFHDGQAWSASLNARSTFDILAGVEQLFNRCVISLEKTLELWYAARDMATLEARDPILEQRERIIEDVGKSIGQLGKILAGIQTLGTEGGVENSDLARIRQELDQSLEVARSVEKRIQSLDREIDSHGLGDDAALN